MTARLFCPAAAQCSPLSQFKAGACFQSPMYKCRMLQERPDVRPPQWPLRRHRLVKFSILASLAGPCRPSRFRGWIQSFTFSLDRMLLIVHFVLFQLFVSVTSAHISLHISAGWDTALSKSWITVLVSEEPATPTPIQLSWEKL